MLALSRSNFWRTAVSLPSYARIFRGPLDDAGNSSMTRSRTISSWVTGWAFVASCNKSTSAMRRSRRPSTSPRILTIALLLHPEGTVAAYRRTQNDRRRLRKFVGPGVTEGFLATPRARTAARLLPQRHLFDGHRAIIRLAHVVDGQCRHRHGDQRLHLDAGAVDRVDTRLDLDEGVGDVEVDVHVAHEHRMGHRQQRRRLLRRLYARDARGGEHVTLVHLVGGHTPVSYTHL